MAATWRFRPSDAKPLILRQAGCMGRAEAIFLTMLRLATERNELRIVDDQIGAPTSSECIAQANRGYPGATAASPSRVGLQGRSGIYNLTCSERRPGLDLRSFSHQPG